MKKPKIIKLKILKCTNPDCWYNKKVGKSYYFFDKIFTDDEGIKSIWQAKPPKQNSGSGSRYAYLENVNYEMAIRKKKLKKINNESEDQKV